MVVLLGRELLQIETRNALAEATYLSQDNDRIHQSSPIVALYVKLPFSPIPRYSLPCIV